jgi:excisionase family DNA binding protein
VNVLLTTRDVAEMLQLSPATVLRRWRNGEIPGYRIASNVLRFDPNEIESWLAGRREHEDRFDLSTIKEGAANG